MFIYLQMIDDEESRSKFEALYQQYKGLMFHIAFGILKHQEDTEDAVHQAFVAIAENMHKVGEVKSGDTHAFVATITERKAIDIVRARKKDMIDISDESLRGIPIKMPAQHGLAEAIAKLPARQRECIILHFYYGYSTREIGKMMGSTQSAIQHHIWRAKQKLKEELESDLNV